MQQVKLDISLFCPHLLNNVIKIASQNHEMDLSSQTLYPALYIDSLCRESMYDLKTMVNLEFRTPIIETLSLLHWTF